MSLTQHPNDCSREAKPGVLWFQGKTLIILVTSVAMGIGIFKSLVITLEWPLAVGLGLIPFALATLFVCTFINGRPKSYAADWVLLAVWKLKTAAYLAGAKDRPSTLWIAGPAPKQPRS